MNNTDILDSFLTPVQKAKKIIVKLVEEKNGIKSVDLSMDLLDADKSLFLEVNSQISNIIDDLVQEGKITALNYTVPTMDYRLKTILFPKGTKVEFVCIPE
jgi:predicted component of type VI protein secretion system